MHQGGIIMTAKASSCRRLLTVVLTICAFFTANMLGLTPLASASDEGTVNMLRLYNPNSGEHFYTANEYEKRNLIIEGWKYEGVGWQAPAHSDTPVYRLYNPFAGDHHYTMDSNERDMLIRAGWRSEGTGWYSSDSVRSYPVLREYNPNARTGTHNYTMNGNEHSSLIAQGWHDEGLAWYATGPGSAAPDPDAQAENIMRAIASSCLQRDSTEQRLACAAYSISQYAQSATYTMKGPDYSQPRGVLVLGVYSCAGTARTAVRVATLMGYSATHVNPNQYTHQWADVVADNRHWVLDGQVGALFERRSGARCDTWTCDSGGCRVTGQSLGPYTYSDSESYGGTWSYTFHVIG